MARTDEDRELMELQAALSASGATVAGMPSGAAAADPQAIQTWELRKQAQAEAYGQYVADGDIWIGNCMTFASGASVPLEHVIRFNLEEREQVNRVATPEMARLGKVFETDEEFLAANPHVAKRLRSRAMMGDAHPSALDPRGGAAALDDARKAGKDPAPATTPGEQTEERQEAVAAAAENLPDGTSTTDATSPKDDDGGPAGQDDTESNGKTGGGKSRRGGRASDKIQEG